MRPLPQVPVPQTGSRRSLALPLVLALACLAALSSALGARAQDARGVTLEVPRVALGGTETELTLRTEGAWPERVHVVVEGGGETLFDETLAHAAELSLSIEAPTQSEALSARVEGAGDAAGGEPVEASASLRVIPAWLSILAPLLAIVLAIALREVVVALVAGVWLGATFVYDGNPFLGLLRTVDTYAVGALADEGHASIAVFSLVLGGTIGVIARSGGALGLAEVVTRVAKDRLSGSLATWLMGLAIFFDDYSNSLLVGTTMRPITDRLRISREKLSFIVDATSAPVSSFAIISSWVGVEVGYIADQYRSLGIEGDPYLVFLETIPYRFYPILMLWFVFLLIVTKRDFGPMLKAERRAVHEGLPARPGSDPASDFDAKELLPPEGVKPRWIHAVLPIAAIVITAMVGMYVTGSASLDQARIDAASDPDALALLDVNLRNIFGKADSLKALLWAAVLGSVVAIGTSMATRTLSLRLAMEAWVAGVRSIMLAVMILVLAWSLGSVCSDLHTAQFVIRAIGDQVPVGVLPAAVFVIAALVSFATGTSWGTMGILFPLVIPLAHELSPDNSVVVLSSVASILSGSVWGDHCSPISDTTIMSSMASSCDHVDHVRTQLPYALVVGAVGFVFGEIATGLGLYGPYVALLLGGLALYGVVRFFGKPVEELAEQKTVAPAATGAAPKGPRTKRSKRR